MERLRLDKLIASQGSWSRKEARSLIRAGRVVVGGQTMVSPEEKVTWSDSVMVDGRTLKVREFFYLMMNKPAGAVCSTREAGHCTVMDLLPPQYRREGLFPAGRLDKDTEGFVLITDDGAFAHRILSPRNHMPKTYLVRLGIPFDYAGLKADFAAGMALGEDGRTSPAELTFLRMGEQPEVELVIYEGMYHQIKRMFGRYGIPVVYLRRHKIGGLELDRSLGAGECRELFPEELQQLQQD